MKPPVNPDRIRGRQVYHSGNLVRFTGTADNIHGGIFYEAEILEGWPVGKIVWIAAKYAAEPYLTLSED